MFQAQRLTGTGRENARLSAMVAPYGCVKTASSSSPAFLVEALHIGGKLMGDFMFVMIAWVINIAILWAIYA